MTFKDLRCDDCGAFAREIELEAREPQNGGARHKEGFGCRPKKEAGRPDFVEDRYLLYLDKLRKSGKTNMFGASLYLERRFDMTRDEARKVVGYWMRTFSSRHPDTDESDPDDD